MEHFESMQRWPAQFMFPPAAATWGANACDKLREVHASECFDKEGLIQAHEEHTRFGHGFEKTGPALRLYSTIMEPCRPSPSLDSLQRMCITQLKESCRPAAGRVVIGELCVDAMKVVSVQTIIEDISAPGKAARLHIYNAVSLSEHQRHVQRMFPKGMRLAIKEPYFKRCKDGALAIRVDNPADLVELMPHHDPFIGSSPAYDTHEHYKLQLQSARDCRKHGNDLFKARDWKAAAQQYSKAISAATMGGGLLSKSKSDDGCPPGCADPLKGELVMAYSNRSETRLRLKYYECAVADTNKALELEPTHLKCLFRKGIALLSLHSYEEGTACLEGALRLDPKNADLKSALKHASNLVKQSSTGHGYNLPKLLEDAAYHSSAHSAETKSKQQKPCQRGPSCAEFVGPVEIRLVSNPSTYISNMQQRGMFLKKDVKCGELLLVSIATGLGSRIEAAENEEHSNVNFILLENQHKISRPETENLILELAERARHSRRIQQQLCTLAARNVIADGGVHEVPNMELFLPNSITAKDCTEQEEELERPLSMVATDVDIDGIRAAVGTNAFSVCSGTSGIWMLPTFINHACSPNTSLLIMNEAIFVRAACDLSAGEELSISYMDVLIPLEMRRQTAMKGWSFECKCQRCRWEEAMMSKEPYGRVLESLNSRYERVLAEKQKIAASGREIRQRKRETMVAEEYRRYKSFAEISEEVEKIVQKYSIEIGEEVGRAGSGVGGGKGFDEWKGWLRASYAQSYWRAFTLMSEGDGTIFNQVAAGLLQKVALEEEVVAGVRKTLPGSESLLIDLRRGLLVEGSPALQRELVEMGVTVYGCQLSPSALAALLSLRSKALIESSDLES